MRQGRVPNDDDMWSLGEEAVIEGMAAGSGEEKLFVHFAYRHVTPIRVDLELRCTAREGGGSWTEHLHRTVTEPVQVSPARRRRFGASFN